MFLHGDSSEISTIFSKLKALSSTKCDDINQSNQELDATHTVYTAKLCGYDNELSQVLSMTDLGNKYTQPTDKRQKDQELVSTLQGQVKSPSVWGGQRGADC